MISVETYKKFMPLSTKEKEKVLLSIDIDEAEKMLSNIDFNDYEQECAIEIPLYWVLTPGVSKCYKGATIKQLT